MSDRMRPSYFNTPPKTKNQMNKQPKEGQKSDKIMQWGNTVFFLMTDILRSYSLVF